MPKLTKFWHSFIFMQKHLQGILPAFLSWKSVHTCHVCTKCNSYVSPEMIADIEDYGNINSGAVMFLKLSEELRHKGWSDDGVDMDADAGDSMKGADAGLDPRMKSIVFKSPENDNVLLKLLPTRCLSACSEPQTIALVGNTEKFSYQFGRIEFENLKDMATVIADYCRSKDGYSSTRTRPIGLKGRVLARIPPINGRRK
jgi:predicted metal-binding protein